MDCSLNQKNVSGPGETASDSLSPSSSDMPYKQTLIRSVWSESRLIASLLDQIGLAYHRVFDKESLELFLILNNCDLSVCYSLDNFNAKSLTELNRHLFTVQSKLISSMDLFVLEALENKKKQANEAGFLGRLSGKHNYWASCAKSRFEQVICPILEQKLIK